MIMKEEGVGGKNANERECDIWRKDHQECQKDRKAEPLENHGYLEKIASSHD